MEKCPKHPKYKGKKKPKHECLGCLSLYSKLGMKPRGKPIPPSKIIPDKTLYDRKSSKKVETEDQ